MAENPFLVFDFDGVIVDGLSEYWNSARKACISILKDKEHLQMLPHDVPEAFQYLRPWVEHGWEMVLIAAELIRPNSLLAQEDYKVFTENYHEKCIEALEKWQWEPIQLQNALDTIRREDIKNDFPYWLNSHKIFPHIKNRLNELQEEGNDIVILTTKNAEFTSKILNSLNIKVNLLYGYESGNKTDILIQLSKNRIVKGFIEDRRATLEKIIANPKLSSIPCFLASWGYLKPNDLTNLPNGIALLDPQTFASPLANWN